MFDRFASFEPRSSAHQKTCQGARVFLAALALSLCIPSAQGQGAKRAETEAELKSVREEIARIREQVGRDEVERDRLARELRTAEISVAEARKELDQLRKERQQRSARRAELAAER